MKDKTVPMFEAILQKNYGTPPSVERLEKELFHIDRKIFIINSKDSIEANIVTVLRFHWREKKEFIMEKTICAICAWRETCQKKFSVSGRDLKCVDYVKDLSIKEEKEAPEKAESEKK